MTSREVPALLVVEHKEKKEKKYVRGEKTTLWWAFPSRGKSVQIINQLKETCYCTYQRREKCREKCVTFKMSPIFFSRNGIFQIGALGNRPSQSFKFSRAPKIFFRDFHENSDKSGERKTRPGTFSKNTSFNISVFSIQTHRKMLYKALPGSDLFQAEALKHAVQNVTGKRSLSTNYQFFMRKKRPWVK